MNTDIGIFGELQKLLAGQKPGVSAQRLMMPENRDLFIIEKNPRKSAVLIALYQPNGSNDFSQIYFPVIRRSVYNGHHSGQMALPGGKHEQSDSNLIDTALREANEEIGINPDKVIILGNLTELYVPVSNITILPVVAYLNSKPDFTINKSEVDSVFTVSLDELLSSESKKSEEQNIHGLKANVPYYLFSGCKVWGATAMILSEFEQIIKKCCLF